MLTFNDTLYTYNSRENVIAPRAVFKELSDKSSDTWYVGLEFSDSHHISSDGFGFTYNVV